MRLKKRWPYVILSTIVILLTAAFTASAAIPNDSYTYWTDVGSASKSVYNKAMYEIEKTVCAKDFGVSDFTLIKNIATDNKDNIYILDSRSRIIVLNKNFELIREIGTVGGTESYDDAESVYIAGDGTIYICDTVGKRILHITADGGLIEMIGKPESKLIPEDFNFTPTNLVIDNYGYIYVVSDGSYFGALLYSPEKKFLGFYGANEVKSTVATVLNNIANRIFPMNEKKANSVKKLPFCFVDIAADEKGFIYTCNGYTEMSDRKGQIRKLSPGAGTNILNSGNVNFVDERISNTSYKGFYKQNITDIAIDSNGFIYALEATYGKIFVYDELCRTITVFGGGMGEGTQKGSFKAATGISLINNGATVVISDGETNLLTVFSLNEYGEKIKELITLTAKGDYEEAKTGWHEVLEQDKNFQPAYSGLARAAVAEEDYKTAIHYAKTGYDRETYALAFKSERNRILSENFVIIFIVAFAVVASILIFIVLSSKKHIEIIKNREIKTLLSTAFHPSNGFYEIKEKGSGSFSACVILVLLFYIVTVLQTLAGGFMFTVYDNASFNSIFVFGRTAGLVVLGVTANWMVCTLLGGNGRFKEIAVVTCYSLLPLIAERILHLVLTNILLPTEAEFLTILEAAAFIWFIFLMINGLLKIHDFSFGRLIGTTLLTLMGIAAIVFLLIMIFILAQQFYGFISTVISELFML